MGRPLITRTSVLVTAGIVAAVVALAFAIAPNPADEPEDGDPFTGRWLVNGVDSLGVEYSGTLTISGSGERYDLQWLVTGGIRRGTGAVRAGRLVAGWVQTEGILEERGGAATYVVDGAGILRGTTSIDGVDGFGAEEGFPPE